nr:MAG TPA: hypothetical protein [Caudoviricetes sp.]
MVIPCRLFFFVSYFVSYIIPKHYISSHFSVFSFKCLCFKT